jgi:hypothetical protein
MENKASIHEIKRVDGRLAEMPTSKELAVVRHELFDKVKIFTADNEQMKISFEHQTAMIARYDQVLSLKCSHQRLVE